ncbi:MAG TPA: hypothetical protein VGM41_01630 [Chitinophagaceae bacterium]
MKTIHQIAIIFILIISASSASAQSDREDITIVQALFGKAKKTIIDEQIQLSEQEKNSFWALYDEYEAKDVAIGTERLELIKQYANQYNSLTDESANTLAQKYLDNNTKYNDLYRSYLKKFQKLIGGLRAAELIQLEIYIQTSIQSNLQQQIPIIGAVHSVQH